MRHLQTSDIFAACRMVNTIGIKEDIKKICMEANSLDEVARNGAGFDLLYTVFEKATEAKGENTLYNFIARLFECEPDEVGKMDPIEFLDKLLEVADVEKWKAFFSRVAALMKRN